MERAVACTKQLLSILNNYNQSTASDNDKLATISGYKVYINVKHLGIAF